MWCNVFFPEKVLCNFFVLSYVTCSVTSSPLDDVSCNFETETVGAASGACGWTPYNNVYNWNAGGSNWTIVQDPSTGKYPAHTGRDTRGKAN